MKKTCRLSLNCNNVKLSGISTDLIEVEIFGADKKEVLDHFHDEELLKHVDEDELHDYYNKWVAHKY